MSKINRSKVLTIMLILGVVLAGQIFGQTKFGPKTEPLLKIFASGTYHMKATASGGGTASDMETYSKGGMIATLMSAQGMNSRIVIKDSKSYMIMDAQKMIMVSSLKDTSSTGAVDTNNITFTGSGTAVFAGKSLPYEEYKTGDGSSVQYFIDGNKLAGIRTVVSGQGNMDMVITVLDQNVPDSIFDIPTGDYQVINMP